MSAPDGGPAFPVQALESEYRDGRYHDVWRPQGGMSLRDYFAAMALQGLIASNDDAAGDRLTELPRYAYDIADAMLRARSA